MADFPPIQEGDALSPSALDAKFDVLEDAVNKVETVSPKTFDHYHGTPSMVEPLVEYGTGARFMAHAGHHPTDRGSEEEYRHSYWLAPFDNAVYRGFDSSQMAIANVQKGWKVIGSNLDGNLTGAVVQGRADGQLECTFASPIGLVDGKSTRTPTLDRIGGILVLLNLEVLYFTGPDGLPRPTGVVELTTQGAETVDTGTTDYTPADLVILKIRAHFGIQVKIKSGTNSGWYNVKKSNRALSMPSSGRWRDLRNTVSASWACGFATSSHTPVRGSLWKDVSIRTLITRDDLDTDGLAQLPDSYTDMVVEGVRAVICLEDGNDTVAGDLWSNVPDSRASVSLKAYSMTTLALGSDYTSEGF